jgi:hypothetical protein
MRSVISLGGAMVAETILDYCFAETYVLKFRSAIPTGGHEQISTKQHLQMDKLDSPKQG